MFGLSPANLDWLCGFYCFEQRRDTVKAHNGPRLRGGGGVWGGNQQLRRLVCRCKCNLIYERRTKTKLPTVITEHGTEIFDCVRNLNLVADSECGEAGGLLLLLLLRSRAAI